jgi:hypothetical protein
MTKKTWKKHDWILGAAYRPLNLQASILVKYFDPNVLLAKDYQPFSDVIKRWYTNTGSLIRPRELPLRGL